MLVDMIPMRAEGRKRPRHIIQADIPVRGHLFISRNPDGDIHADLRHGPTHQAEPIASLHGARVLKLDGAGLIVAGHELAGYAGETQPQAWWCRWANSSGPGQAGSTPGILAATTAS